MTFETNINVGPTRIGFFTDSGFTSWITLQSKIIYFWRSPRNTHWTLKVQNMLRKYYCRQLFSSSLFFTSHSTCVHPGMEKAWKGAFVKRYLSLPTWPFCKIFWERIPNLQLTLQGIYPEINWVDAFQNLLHVLSIYKNCNFFDSEKNPLAPPNSPLLPFGRYLYRNKLSGCIPDSIGSLVNLKKL